MQIKILAKNDLVEKNKTRTLYEMCFDHGKDDFINYYYDTIIKRNEVVALFDDEKIVSMVHLNPYFYNIFGKEYKVHYIVAVATEPKYRKQGLMHQVIKAALDYLKNMNEPFCYLLPEDDGVMKTYSKIGFVDVCNFNVDKFSENKYDIYPVKNAEYLSLMKNEEMFLSKETDEYRAELAKKRVMFYIFQYPNSPIKSIEILRKKKIYICQEV